MEKYGPATTPTTEQRVDALDRKIVEFMARVEQLVGQQSDAGVGALSADEIKALRSLSNASFPAQSVGGADRDLMRFGGGATGTRSSAGQSTSNAFDLAALRASISESGKSNASSTATGATATGVTTSTAASSDGGGAAQFIEELFVRSRAVSTVPTRASIVKMYLAVMTDCGDVPANFPSICGVTKPIDRKIVMAQLEALNTMLHATVSDSALLTVARPVLVRYYTYVSPAPSLVAWLNASHSNVPRDVMDSVVASQKFEKAMTGAVATRSSADEMSDGSSAGAFGGSGAVRGRLPWMAPDEWRAFKQQQQQLQQPQQPQHVQQPLQPQQPQHVTVTNLSHVPAVGGPTPSIATPFNGAGRGRGAGRGN